jgi:predicted dehydrogenase
MSRGDFRLALIGTGNISGAHRRAMAELKGKGLNDFALTAVCDVHPEAAQYAADDAEQLFGLRPAIYTDYQELLAREKLDGADLCLPIGLHHLVAVDCLEAGIPVLCEKPLGITVKAARRMAGAAARSGRILSTAHQSRRQQSQRAIHWALNTAKLIGEPQTFFHQHAQEWPAGGRTPSWIERRREAGGGPLINCGIHYLDTMRYFFGDLDKVYAEAREWKSGQPKRLDKAIEDALYATLVFKNGIVGSWAYSLAAPGESTTDVMFYGTQGSLRDSSQGRFRCWCHLLSADGRLNVLDSGQITKGDGAKLSLDEVKRMYLESLGEEQKEQLFPRGVTNAMAVEIWEFLEAVRGKRRGVEVDGWEGLKAVAACHALYESALTGEVIAVDDVLSGKRGAYQSMIDEYWKL